MGYILRDLSSTRDTMNYLRNYKTNILILLARKLRFK